MLAHPPSTTLFPYTTLFRSKSKTVVVVASTEAAGIGSPADPPDIAALTGGTSAVVDEKHAAIVVRAPLQDVSGDTVDRKSTRLNSSHEWISYAVFCLKKKKH